MHALVTVTYNQTKGSVVVTVTYKLPDSFIESATVIKSGLHDLPERTTRSITDGNVLFTNMVRTDG